MLKDGKAFCLINWK